MSRKKRQRSNRLPPRASDRPAESSSARRGLLDSFLTARPAGPTSMPGLGRSIGRGFATVLTSPWLIAMTLVVPLVLWVLVVLAGFRGPVSPLGHILSPPPLSTLTFDSIVANAVGGGSGFTAILTIVVTVVLRAVIHAAFAGLVVDQLQGGASSHLSIVRGIQALPATIAVSLGGFVSLNVGSVLGAVAGGGLALFAQIAVLVLGVYLLAFAPFVALTEPSGPRAALSKAVRATRMPGAGNLTFAAIYTFVAVVVYLTPKSGSLLGVNPSLSAWLVILATSFLHVAALAALGYRYLSVADDIPEAAPRTEPVRPGRR